MSSAPSALLCVAPGCPHCPGIKQALAILMQEGAIAGLEVVDITREPERAQALGVRSVPWLRLGVFQFEGTHTLGELRRWAGLAAQAGGIKTYFQEMLKSGQRGKVENLIRANPAHAAWLAELAFDGEVGMETRLGVGAVLEELQGTGLAEAMVPLLAARLAETDPRHRADAAHFLSLIGGAAALAALQPYADDADAEVREIARAALGIA